jgi:aminopeptidase-like protein
LRTLRDWRALAAKLPDPTCGLVSIIAGQPKPRLDCLEWQVWEFADGSVSLRAIATQLGLPIVKVQQIAFRLILVNLAVVCPTFSWF